MQKIYIAFFWSLIFCHENFRNRKTRFPLIPLNHKKNLVITATLLHRDCFIYPWIIFIFQYARYMFLKGNLRHIWVYYFFLCLTGHSFLRRSKIINSMSEISYKIIIWFSVWFELLNVMLYDKLSNYYIICCYKNSFFKSICDLTLKTRNLLKSYYLELLRHFGKDTQK